MRVWDPNIGERDIAIPPGVNPSADALNTVGAGTLTAALMYGGIVLRGGAQSGSAFTDTTDTAANICAAMGASGTLLVNQSFECTIINNTNAPETVAAGSGVTLAGVSVVPPGCAAKFLVTATNVTPGSQAVAVLGEWASSAAFLPVTVTALNTVGAGTITGAGIAGGVTSRGGAQAGAAFTDTTDTVANIIAARPNAVVGQSWQWTYDNNTNAVATISGAASVTVTGTNIIPAGSWARYLVTITAATTISVQCMETGTLAPLPPAQFKTAALTAGTLAAGSITGANFCVLQNTGGTPGAQTTRTAAQMLADTPGGYVGMTTTFRIVNTGAGTLTLTMDASVTGTGTLTVAQNVFRDYALTFNTATTATIQSIGSGTSP